MLPAYLWGLFAAAITLVGMVPYLMRTIKGRNRPHVFTWVIWGILAGIAFCVQYTQGAGAGSWATALTCAMCFLVALVALRHGRANITRVDWVVLITALAAIPLWLMTDSAALAAIWVTGIDGLGYIPTIRKSWLRPQEEMVFPHALANVKHVCSLLAMGSVSVSTAFYPAALFLFNAVLCVIILTRRVRMVGPEGFEPPTNPL